MKKDKYLKKLKDPRWQKKRLEIFERDNWQCQSCSDKQSPLNVHHKKYIKNKNPWDYPDKLLITLCETCHENKVEPLSKNQRIISLKKYLKRLQTRHRFVPQDVTSAILGQIEMVKND